MPDKRIDDYALISDCETAALVSRDGSIDWLCWPNFSSPACFAKLLGDAENGHWSLAPDDQRTSFTRRYRPHTMLLETTMKTRKGTVVVTDFMPNRGKHSDLIRRVTCVEGKVRMRTELCPRFDYGSTIPLVKMVGEGKDEGWTAKAGPDMVVLRTEVALSESTPGTLTGAFALKSGESRTFVLTYGRSYEPVPEPVDAELEIERSERFWSDWAACSKYQGPHADLVERSLLTLKALTFRPSGGIVAAPTTSLPERVGGSLNWDYRYCWIRDASLTLSALIEAGYTDEVTQWKQWLIRAIGRDAAQVQIMYGIGGERRIDHWEVPWLAGYNNSKPVRVGNLAVEQKQQDIYGEIAAALFHAREAGVPCDQEELELQQALTEYLATIWKEPGSGMWEEREKQQLFTYSMVMGWVAIDRAVGSIERHGMEGPARKWKKLREQIHAEICKRGFHKGLNSFVQYFGSKQVDASLLWLPILGFLPANDPRIVGTVQAIEQQLFRDGLLLRNIPKTKKGKQGAFLACSFWLVEVYVLQGRVAEARALFERVIVLTNDVGLLAEEYDTKGKQLVGNFPQALSHIALIRAAFRVAGCL